MDETTTVTASQAETDDTDLHTPQAGESHTSADPQAGDAHKSDTISLEEAKKLRSESANLRKRLKAYEEAEEKARLERMNEQERLQKQYSDLKSQHDALIEAQFQERMESAIERHALRAGIDPKLTEKVGRLIDWEQIEINDEGQPTNLADLIGQLTKEMPALLSSPQGKSTAVSSGGATNPPRSAASRQELSWDAIGKMTAQEYEARRNDIQIWMQTNPPRFR